MLHQSPDSSLTLTDREKEIARRVREALHLSPSMSEEAVAAQFRGTMAWRRARLRMTTERLQERLAEAFRPTLSRIRAQLQSLIRRAERIRDHFRH